MQEKVQDRNGMATETKNPAEKTLSVSSSKTLTLKPRADTSVVKQSFSHGRQKTVVKEVVKRRTVGPAPAKVEAKAAEPAPAVERGTAARRPVARGATPPPAAAPAAPAAPAQKSGVVLRKLTKEEQEARTHALADARLREAEERKIAEEDARIRTARDAIERTEREAAEASKRGEEDRRRHDEETKRKADEVAKKRFGEEEARAKGGATPTARKITPEADDDDRRPARRGVGGAPVRPAAAPKAPRAGAPKQRGRLTLVTALNADEVRERSVASFRRRTQRITGHRDSEQKEKLVREVTIPETITIAELANRMSERSVDVIKILMKQGHMAKITDTVDADTAQLLAEELGHTARRRVGRGRGPVRCRRRSGDARAAAAGRDHHGSCRPRQDVAARCDPADQCGKRGSGRHHPAHR